MRNKKNGKPKLVLKSAQKIENARLNGNIERGDRLIGHENARLEGKRARNGNSLALPARHFTRILVKYGRTQPHISKKSGNTIIYLFIAPRDSFAVSQNFRKRLANGHSRIEGAYSILKDHLHGDIGAIHRAARNALKPHKRLCYRGFAAPRLADNPDNLALAKRKRNALYRFVLAVFDAKRIYLKKVRHRQTPRSIFLHLASAL